VATGGRAMPPGAIVVPGRGVRFGPADSRDVRRSRPGPVGRVPAHRGPQRRGSWRPAAAVPEDGCSRQW